MFEIGDFVFDKMTGDNVQILERIELWGFVSYKVFDSMTGQVYKVNEEQLNIAQETMSYDENYLRYLVWLAKIKNETAEGILSATSSGIIPLPHQMHALNKALEGEQIRYILADEVGLGKTIEAGLIIKELKARGLVKRVLVVCPTGLVTQWSNEMKDKFYEKFQVILPSDYDTIRRITDSTDVYGQYDQVISPMDSIKPIEKHVGWSPEKIEAYNQERIYSIINSGWDLIIIDEAHRVAGSSGEVARYKLGQMLSKASPYLLLLSATPHNGKTEPFLRLVRLLDEDAFPNAKSIIKEQVVPFLIRTEKREAIDNNGEFLFKNRITHLISMEWEERHSFQKELYNLISEYVAKSYNKASRNKKKNMCLIFLLIIMQRMATSSTAAVKDSLQKRLFALQNKNLRQGELIESDLDGLNIESDVEDAIESVSLDSIVEIEEIQNMLAIAKQAEFQSQDIKLEKLTEIIDRIVDEDRSQKIIVFTEFVATQKFLQEFLIRKGYSVTILNGGMSIEERNEALQEFRTSTTVFISTDAGGEGLNLQFANIIINYDLPWNPMKIEQRCGRVDRIGQQRDVHIYNFIVRDTIENRVREVIEEKLSVIMDEMGVDKYSDVLDSEVAEYDFTDVYMKSIVKPYNIEKNIQSVEFEMKQQMDNSKKYKEIIREDKELGYWIGKESNFDTANALRLMLTYFDHWKNNESRLIEDIGIADDEVKEHLNAEVLQDRSTKILSVGIHNFPNEAGYFMLWKLSVSNKESGQKIIPIFVNDNNVLRPMAGKRIMDVFLDPTSILDVQLIQNVNSETYEQLTRISKEFAYDTFIDLKTRHTRHAEENYNKYKYAIELRMDAAENIGIENIRNARVQWLEKEMLTLENDYKKDMQVYPEFKLMALVRLEA